MTGSGRVGIGRVGTTGSITVPVDILVAKMRGVV